MKKNKTLLPLIGAVSMVSSITPVMTLTSCNKNNNISIISSSEQIPDKNGIAYFEFQLKTLPKDNRLFVLLDTNATIKLGRDIIYVNPDTKSFSIPILIHEAYEAGEIKFALTFSYTNQNGNTETQKIDNLIIKHDVIIVEPLLVAIQSDFPYAFDKEPITFKSITYPTNSTFKKVVWSYDVPSTTHTLSVSQWNQYTGEAKFEGYGDINITATSIYDPSISNTVTFTVLSDKQLPAYRFATDSWENICEWANRGSTIFKEHYGFQNDYEIIGLERYITLDGFVHRVRVVDVDHDKYGQDNKPATLTFELANVITDYSGARKTTWNETPQGSQEPASNYNFLESFLKEVLDGSTTTWELDPETPCCWDTFKDWNPTLAQNIKPVKKQVAVSTDKTTYQLKQYETKIFAMTMREMVGWDISEHCIEEGTTYRYYAQNETPRRKTDIWGGDYTYWLSSPSKMGSNQSIYVDYSGDVHENEIYRLAGVAYCFCI